MIAPKARAASGILYVYNSENNNHIYSAIVDVKGTCVLAIPPPEKVIWYAIVHLIQVILTENRLEKVIVVAWEWLKVLLWV